jgi:hypothetical protein
VHRHLVPSIISRGAPCQAISETSVSEEWKRARNVRETLPASSDFHDKLQGSLTCRKPVTWDRWLYFPSEGRHAEDFFSRKIRWFWPGSNPRSLVPEASILTTRLPKPLHNGYRVFPGGIKRLGCDADPSPPSSAKV